jgi:hypothetical protein
MKKAFSIIVSVLLCKLVIFNIAAHADVMFYGAPYRSGSGATGGMDNLTHVKISGLIKKNDINDLKICIERHNKHRGSKLSENILVLLDSQGGDVIAAMEMGKILRENKAEIWVLPGSECSSACVFILASGVHRVICGNTKIGIHRPIFDEKYFSSLDYAEAAQRYKKLTNELHEYLSKMDIKDSLFEEIMSIKSNEVEYISSDYAESVGLDGEDRAYEEWQRAKEVQRYGKKSIIWYDKWAECVRRSGDVVSCRLNVVKACQNDKDFSNKECSMTHHLLLYPGDSRAEAQERMDNPPPYDPLLEEMEKIYEEQHGKR